MLDDVDAMHSVVIVANMIDAHAKYAPFKNGLGVDEFRCFFHSVGFGKVQENSVRQRSYSGVQQRSSIATEIGWLAYFFIIFVIAVYLLNLFLVPHHFNDKIADTLAAIVAALVMIGTRAAYAKRSGSR